MRLNASQLFTAYRLKLCLFAASLLGVIFLTRFETSWALTASPASSVPGVVHGTVQLQRPNAPSPHPSWEVPVTVTLHHVGNPQPDQTANATTDQEGRFTAFFSFAPGEAYDLRVKNMHTLRNVKRNVVLPTQFSEVHFGTLLEGDANDDNRINIQDFSILRAAYFTQSGDPNFDPRADFDEDGRINIRDFSLLRLNYFMEGDIEVTSSPQEIGPAIGAQLRPTNHAAIQLQPDIIRGQREDVIQLEIVVDPVTHAVDGVDAVLAFDPGAIQIVDEAGDPANHVTPGTYMSELYNQVDNNKGQVVFAGGTLEAPATSPFVLATMYVRFVAEKSSEIMFTADTDMVEEGVSIVGTKSGANINVVARRQMWFVPYQVRGANP